MVLKEKKATHTVKLYGIGESRASTREEYPQLQTRRGVTFLQCATRDSLHEGGVADISEADRDTLEAREFICRHRVVPREQLYVPNKSSFSIFQKSLTS